MASTTEITQGIKAIKINRDDLQSSDNTLSLQELEVLRIRFSDKGIQEFIITSIAEYKDYYLFYVVPKNLFSNQSLFTLQQPLVSDSGSYAAGGYFQMYSANSATTGSTGRVSNYNTETYISSSFVDSIGQLTPWIPETVDITVQYAAGRVGGYTRMTAFLTGSDGMQGNFNWDNLYELPSGGNNPFTQSFSWTPATPSSSVGIGFYQGGAYGVAATALVLSSSIKVTATQPDFYLADNVVEDESLNAEANGVQTITAGTLLDITTWDFVGGQYYALSGPNNVGLQTFTCSFSAYGDNASGAGNPSMSIGLVSTRNGTVASASYVVGVGGSFPVPPSGVYYLSGSYTVTGDEQLYISVAETTGNRNLKIRSGSWEINQAIDAQSGSPTQTILEPYLTANFQYSDCNVLAGNAVEARVNDFYMDVDYSSNAIVAVNEQSILNGNATRATVQQSNYTTAGIINSRYIGKELTAANLNTWTEGDVAFGKSVTVGNAQSYFSYFNWVGGTSPEWGNNLSDRTSVNIRYFIDENGDVIDPINDSEGINLGIVRQNYPDNQNAIISLDSDDEFGVNLGALNAEWPVFKSGYSIAPILYTQTASYNNNGDVIGFGYTGSIDFVLGDLSPDNTIADYQLYTFPTASQTVNRLTSFPYTISFSNNPTILGTSASFSSNEYSPITTNPSGSVTLSLVGAFRANVNTPLIATFALQKNGTTVKTVQIDFRSTTQGSLTYTDNSAKTTDDYKLVITNVQDKGPTGDIAELDLSTQTYFRTFQSPLPGGGGCTSFWTVGSPRSQITASGGSTGLNSFYGQTQRDIDRSGFNPITLPFTVEVGDEIRFEGSETLAYEILSVSQSSTGNIVLNLNGTIPTGTNTNYFLLRRYIDDPAYVILEVDKPAGPSSGGILKPQYLSSRIEGNLDTILKDLQDKQLI